MCAKRLQPLDNTPLLKTHQTPETNRHFTTTHSDHAMHDNTHNLHDVPPATYPLRQLQNHPTFTFHHHSQTAPPLFRLNHLPNMTPIMLIRPLPHSTPFTCRTGPFPYLSFGSPMRLAISRQLNFFLLTMG